MVDDAGRIVPKNSELEETMRIVAKVTRNMANKMPTGGMR